MDLLGNKSEVFIGATFLYVAVVMFFICRVCDLPIVLNMTESFKIWWRWSVCCSVMKMMGESNTILIPLGWWNIITK